MTRPGKCTIVCHSDRRQEAPSSSYRQTPQTGYLLFDNAPSSQAVLKKLREFSQTLGASSDHQNLALTEEQSGAGLEHLIARHGHTCCNVNYIITSPDHISPSAHIAACCHCTDMLIRMWEFGYHHSALSRSGCIFHTCIWHEENCLAAGPVQVLQAARQICPRLITPSYSNC